MPMLKFLRNSQRGFTLIELLAVMAIVATLAGIVATSVSGSGSASRDVQTQQDATTVGSAVADFFSDQQSTEVIKPSTATVLDEEGISQITSSKWPEFTIASAYPNAFPPTRDVVAAVSFFNEDGTPSVLSVRGLLENYNAVDFGLLEGDGYLQQVPDGAAGTINGYGEQLWLLKKTTASGGGPGTNFNHPPAAGTARSPAQHHDIALFPYQNE